MGCSAMTDRDPLYRRSSFSRRNHRPRRTGSIFGFRSACGLSRTCWRHEGIIVSHQTVQALGREIRAGLRQPDPPPLSRSAGDKWHPRRGRSFDPAVRSTGSGAPSIRTVLFWRFWCKVAAMPRRPSVPHIRACRLAHRSARTFAMTISHYGLGEWRSARQRLI